MTTQSAATQVTERILLVAPAWVGDMVMAHALVRRLAERPGVEVQVLAPPATAPLGPRMSGVAATHQLQVGHGELGWRRRRAMARALREQGFDQAILLPNTLKSALIPLWARIPRRTGWHGEHRYGLVNDRRRLDPAALPLMVERFLALGQAAGEPLPRPYPLPVLDVDPANRSRLLEEFGLGDEPAVVLCPGAEFGAAKRWPVQHYARLARDLDERGAQVWVLGSPAERGVGEQIGRLAPNVVNLAGRTRLVDAVDLLAGARVVVCNDSGLMHVAGAVGVPVVAVFGSTSPDFTPPLGAGAATLRLELPCSPCFRRSCPLGHTRCLTELAPATVLGPVVRVLAGG